FVADQTDANIVYIAGGGQPGPFPNSLGAHNSTDRVFRGDASRPAGSQWTSVTNNGANGTSPHADNRDLQFDAAGNLLSANDGGIYRLVNPNLSSRRWVSVIGDIRATELYSVAYDSINHTLLGGAQDTGSPAQT